MRFTASTDVDKFETDPAQAFKYAAMALEQLGQILNNGLLISDNFNAKVLTIAFDAANTDKAALHGLGRAPTGYIQIGQTAATSVYDGAGANTAQLLYLRASATATVRIMVF